MDLVLIAMIVKVNDCLQGRAASVTGLNIDLVLIAMIVKGNDYLPAVRGISGSANSLTLWKSYLRLRQSPQWSNQ